MLDTATEGATFSKERITCSNERMTDAMIVSQMQAT
jgi:hypothetical protein